METDSDRARFNMVQQQVRPWDVLDGQVLEVMEGIRREPFVPDAYQGLAYADIEVPLSQSRSLPSPKLVGRMLQALDVQPGDKALEIGSTTGYLSACLCRLGAQVVAIEPDAALAAEARGRLADLGCSGVRILELEMLGPPAPGGPFNLIALNGSVADAQTLVPLEQQLALGGRLFCILGWGVVMRAYLITRVGPRELRREALFETSAAPLVPEPHPPAFVF